MRGLWRLTVVQWKLFVREPAAFFFTLIFPTLLLLLIGAIWGNAPDPIYDEVGFGAVDHAVPAYAGVILGTVALLSIPISTAGLRQRKVLKLFRTTPMTPLTYFAADVAVAFAAAIAGGVLVTIVGKVVFGLRFGGSLAGTIAAFALSAVAFFAVGYVIASLAPTERTAQAIGQAVFFPMLFLSGATFPTELMPAWLQRVSDVLPLTQVVEVMQGAWFGRGVGSLWPEILYLGALLVGGALLSVRLFRWQ